MSDFGSSVANATLGGLGGFSSSAHDYTTGALNSLKIAAGVVGKGVGVAHPIAGPISAGVGMVCDSVVDGIDAWNTQSTVAQLKIVEEAGLQLLQENGSTHYQDLFDVMELALKKKRRHRDIMTSQAGTVQIAKPFTQAYRAGRAIYKGVKGTKGVSRAEAVEKLLKAKNDRSDPTAAAVADRIIEIVAQRNFQDLMRHTLEEAFRS